MPNRGISHLQDILTRHGAGRGLDLHLVSTTAAATELLRGNLPAAPVAVVADDVTAQLAGATLAAALDADLLIIPPRLDGAVVAGRPEADALAQKLQAGAVGMAIAVGAGTINDLTKFACHQIDIPATVVATAASMNGYTSACAALLEDGIKLSIPCPPPRRTILPIDLLCAAPPRMTAAGFADLRSRPVSGADWYLGHRLLGTPYDVTALDLVAVADELAGEALDGLSQRTPAAIAALASGLLVSGLAMDIAGTSAPSSGGEHLVSHYLDMFHFACAGPHDLHGCQVGVATLAMAHLYERLLAVDVQSLQPAPLPPWDAVHAGLADHFGPLWTAVEPVARQVHGNSAQRAARVAQLRQHWPDTAHHLHSLLGADPTSPGDLRRAGAPTRFAQLGVSADDARAALLHARYVRTRYTILDLAADLGVLDTWVDQLLAAGAL